MKFISEKEWQIWLDYVKSLEETIVELHNLLYGSDILDNVLSLEDINSQIVIFAGLENMDLKDALGDKRTVKFVRCLVNTFGKKR